MEADTIRFLQWLQSADRRTLEGVRRELGELINDPARTSDKAILRDIRTVINRQLRRFSK